MKSYRIVSLLLLLFLASRLSAQTFTLTFSATDGEGNPYRLDSVQVRDMSQGWTTTLLYPDTTMNLTVGQNTILTQPVMQTSMQVFPNPAQGKAYAQISSNRDITGVIKLLRSDGVTLCDATANLTAGTNTIQLNPGGEGLFYVQFITDGTQNSQKFIALSSEGSPSIKVLPSGRKSGKGDNTGTFATSDIMRLVGYATFQNATIESSPIVRNITSSQTFNFQLPINYSAPIVTTTYVDDVTTSSATCGGLVENDGGKPVTTRGFCYSSDHTPTIEDYITSNGEGTGSYSTTLENLQPGTTYLVRAYAFNALGFAYGDALAFTTPMTDNDPSDDGALPGLFSINDSTQIVFSKGNLQYSTMGNHLTADGEPTSGTWRFAEAQYLYAGDANAFIGPTYAGFIDLFGWGTSGWSGGGAEACQPYSSSTANEDYISLSDITSTNADWGHYNAIQNGGNEPAQWRVLSASEWQYLFDNNEARNGRYAEATITSGSDEYHGMILLPDLFDLPDGCQYTAGYANGYATNNYSLDQWESMEQAGAVFLVAAGRRNGTDLAWQNSRCIYWSGTANDNSSARLIFIISGAMTSDGADQIHSGASVRLVRNAQ